MSFLDTLLIDGTNIRTIDGLAIVGAIQGLWAPGARRGDDDAPGGRDGELGAPLPLAKYVIEIPVQLTAASRGERNDLARSLGALIGGYATNGLVQLNRHIATGTAGDHLTQLAQGRFITGLDMAQINPRTGRTTLQYYNLSGGWNDGTGTYVIP